MSSRGGRKRKRSEVMDSDIYETDYTLKRSMSNSGESVGRSRTTPPPAGSVAAQGAANTTGNGNMPRIIIRQSSSERMGAGAAPNAPGAGLKIKISTGGLQNRSGQPLTSAQKQQLQLQQLQRLQRQQAAAASQSSAGAASSSSSSSSSSSRHSSHSSATSRAHAESKHKIETALSVVSQPVEPPSPGSQSKRRKKRAERLTTDEFLAIIQRPHDQPTAAFWKDMQQYFDPLTEEHMKLLEVRALEPNDEVFDMPKLGTHYTKVWAMQDNLAYSSSRQARYKKGGRSGRGGSELGDERSMDVESMGGDDSVLSGSADGLVLEGLDEDVSKLPVAREHKQHTLTQRILSALVEDKLVPREVLVGQDDQLDEEGNDDDDDAKPSDDERDTATQDEDDQETLTKEEEEWSEAQGIHTDSDLAALYGGSSKGKRAAGIASAPLEERMRMELEAIGLLGESGQVGHGGNSVTLSTTTSEAHLAADERQDDEISCRIRYLQKALKRQVDRNNKMRARLLNTITATRPFENGARELRKCDEQVEHIFIRRMHFQEDRRDGLLDMSREEMLQHESKLLHHIRNALKKRESLLSNVPLTSLLPYVYFAQPPTMGPPSAGATGFVDGKGFAYGAKQRMPRRNG